MRISDWSSDVCSSDLVTGSSRWVGWSGSGAWRTTGSAAFPAEEAADDGAVEGGEDREHDDPEQGGEDDREEQDRKSVVQGKRGSVLVDLGGRGIIQKKKLQTIESQNRESTQTR